MKYFCLLLSLSLLVSCVKDNSAPPPDIITGLTAKISLDGTLGDSVSGTQGSGFNIFPVANRHNELAKAMYFRRSDSAYIDMGDLEGASFPNGVFTISCWVKVVDTSNALSILSKRNANGPFEYSLDSHFGHSSFKLDNWIADGSHTVYGIDPLNAAAAITPNTWQQIAFVGDSAELRVYINGVVSALTDMRQVGYQFTNTGGHFVIGNGGAYSINNPFDGAIDDIRLYNRALTAKDVFALSQL